MPSFRRLTIKPLFYVNRWKSQIMENRESMMEELLLDKGWTPAKLETEIRSAQEKFAGLLTREGAMELVCRGNHLNVPRREKKYDYLSLAETARLPEGATASFVARVKHVYAPKSFVTKNERGERRGRVCNLTVSDASGEGVLVLWNKDVDLVQYGDLERNDLVRIGNALVKKSGEYTSALTTRITPAKQGSDDDDAGIPLNPVRLAKLAEIKPGEEGFDCYCRVLSVSQLREFSRQKNGIETQGFVCDALVSDGSTSCRLVGWDDNAKTIAHLKVGEAVKIEGGSAKAGQRDGKLEVHASWNCRILRNAKGHELPEREEIWRQMYSEKPLAELPLDTPCIVTARLDELIECRAIDKTTPSGKARTLILLKAVLSDETGQLPCAFFDAEALEVLGLTELTVEPQAALDIKKEYLIGSRVTAVVTLKEGYGRKELTASHVISVAQKASD